MTSLRPETVSSIAAGTFPNMIASTIPNIQTTVIFLSDNEAAVKNSHRTSLHDVGTVLENDMDVTIQNVRIVKKSLIYFSMSHVHGHQDNNTDKKNLPPIARINVEMDELIGNFLHDLDLSKDYSKPLPFPSQQVRVALNGKRISSNIEDLLISEYYRPNINKHYQKVVKLDPSSMPNAQWNSLWLALRDYKSRDYQH